MSQPIPVYDLSVFQQQHKKQSGLFFLGATDDRPQVRIDQPYRSSYYKIGICFGGHAELKVDLNTYHISAGYVIAFSPSVVKQWTVMSEDYDSLDVFFTKDFITTNNLLQPDSFPFFEAGARHAFPITEAQMKPLADLLRLIHEKYRSEHAYKDDVLRNLINTLLYEMTPLYSEQQVVSNAKLTRSQTLTAQFKKLVSAHFHTERNLAFYAGQLYITPKHLTETIKEVTGKTAGDWIAEAVMLEAKVLLQHPALSIAQIADQLHFPDQSTFGRFFKKEEGLSPAAYKQSL